MKKTIENEARLIAGALYDPEWCAEMVSYLEDRHFADPYCKLTFQTIAELLNAGRDVTQEAVFERLKEKPGYADFLAKLSAIVPKGLVVLDFIKEAKESASKRELSDFLRKAHERLMEPCLMKDFRPKFEAEYFALSEDPAGEDEPAQLFGEGMAEFICELTNRRNHFLEGGSALEGVPSGYKELDEALSGLCSSQLIVIAARPRIGKTSIALNLIQNLCFEKSVPACFFSIEMSKRDIQKKLISQVYEVPFSRLRSGNISEEDFKRLRGQVESLCKKTPFLLAPVSALTMDQLYSRCLRYKKSHGIKVVIIDYLQLMRDPSASRENRQLEVASISRRLKQLAKALDMSVIALAQVNRQSEQRQDKVPYLSELRESGAIEADADAVIMIHRPELYEPDKRPGFMELHIAKNRFGPTGRILLKFNKEIGRITNDDTFSQSHEFGAISEPQSQRDRFSQFDP